MREKLPRRYVGPVLEKQVNSIKFFEFGHLAAQPGLVHGVASRQGGESSGAFASLNISYGVGDDPEAVATNRRLICEASAIPVESLAMTRPCQGPDVAVVRKAELERAPEGWLVGPDKTDGLITTERGLFLMMSFGDCVPLLFYDPTSGAFSLTHAGWTGVVARMGERVVQAMEREFGCKSQDLMVGIGPAIGPCCYQVGQNVIDLARAAFPGRDELLVRQPDGSMHFDLWEGNRRALLEAGVRPDNIELAGLCTFCHNELFFSHRAQKGQSGRFAAIIGLKAEDK